MKTKIFNIGCIGVLLMIGTLSACKKQLDSLAPHNVNFENQQFGSPNGYTKATIGNYTALYTSYETPWFNISEYRGNNVKVIDVTSTSSAADLQNTDAFKYNNSESKDFGLSDAFWFASYKALLGVNVVLKNVSATETNNVILQAKAENLFLRAFINFNLLRVYGRPYYQSPATNLGIPIITAPLDLTATPPARASVQASYDQVIADLNQSIATFKSKGVNSFASKYGAFALLSRVYLYMSGTFDQPNANYARLSAQAADSVILNGGYRLLQGTAYSNYYAASNQLNTETIWAINHEASTSNLPILLMQPQGTYVGLYTTGQIKPSPDLLGKLAATDLRKNFYFTDLYPGNTTDVLSTNKYSYRFFNGVNGVYYSYAAFNHLRLAEVYLNRAEARLKAGDTGGALADLNVIHTRAGLTALVGLSGQALFDAILLERRLELAFEGHNSYDYFRNGLPMVRNYSSFNSPPLTVNPTDAKVVMRISQLVLTENPNIIQNQQ
ncbi:RagB/SusD family nutrient uptake outer membrane protein [Pedobacter sp. HDW13]|uniref:RagB/SusD family nutrient uptake outer membrane protein n=1 Tax=Pedobacter sp. HDW13 TaxID=2714940 RepID=UPI0014079777|nr:RagB/SusD family nutrient uptake outer membrane protein [Pedobacter sp. HDW13]QIL37832.1 RagB/SusD family nutrient uptake outer membrane protein [Pedobacter sp. HDW13]